MSLNIIDITRLILYSYRNKKGKGILELVQAIFLTDDAAALSCCHPELSRTWQYRNSDSGKRHGKPVVGNKSRPVYGRIALSVGRCAFMYFIISSDVGNVSTCWARIRKSL